MCGIVGIINLYEKNNKLLNNELSQMLKGIYKRGPDGEGRYNEKGIAIGMRRLSIIDLEGGFQPFFSGKNNEIIVFQNGEIYNYKELAKELKHLGYSFRSHSDTEVLAHGYDAWGKDLFKKLDGMYAIAILDKRRNKFILARDRFGEKPLYYYYNKNKKIFIYSSDMLTIVKNKYFKEKIKYNKNALSRYLMLGFSVLEDAMIDKIKKVLPSFYIELDLSNFNLNKYCYYLPNLEYMNYENPKKELEKKLNSSIDIRLRSDVPLGVFLSGGVDSSLVAAMASKKHQNIDTFSIGFYSDIHDESRYSKLVAKYIGSNHHHFMFDENSFNQLLPEVVSNLDEPIADQAALPTYWLAKEAKKIVTVVLSGEGADEIFGGYSYFLNENFYEKLVDYNKNTTPSGYPLLMDINSCKYFMNINFEKETEAEKELFDWIATGRSELQKSMVTDLTTWLPDDLLVKVDRMTMAHSLEGRAPYLSKDIVDFSYSLSNDYWITKKEYKKLLREVAKDYLPDEILNRPKQGFVLPMDEWIKKWFEKESVKEFFSKREIKELNTDAIITWVNNQLKEKYFNQRLIYAFMVLYLWNEKLMKGIKDERKK